MHNEINLRLYIPLLLAEINFQGDINISDP